MIHTKEPIVVAYGLGRDSTAMLIRMHQEGITPDAILWANVGSEKRATYAYLPVIQDWLRSVGFPPVTVVRYTPRHANYTSIEGNMILNGTLPGATFGFGSCTMKFKIEPQSRWLNAWGPAQIAWGPAQIAWATGRQVRRFIGFEACEGYRKNRADCKAHSTQNEKQRAEYPLMDWGMDLAACIETIRKAGLLVPPKSACYFCPNMQPAEVHEMSPEDRAKLILIEVAAEPFNAKMHGLWRRPRIKAGLPGSITEYILTRGLEFSPLREFCDVILLSPACNKARTGFSLKPPHLPVSVRELLEMHGHWVPPVVTSANPGQRVYQEDYREAPAAIEDAVHAELIASL